MNIKESSAKSADFPTGNSGTSANVYELIPSDKVPSLSRDVMSTSVRTTTDDGENDIAINVSVPDFHMQINLSVNRTEAVWNIKMQLVTQVTVAIKTDLKDSLNYGLYIPPVNGKAGKFLSEERSLKDQYLSSGCSLELKYKRREYKQGLLKQRKLDEINSKTYRKKFLHYVRLANVTKLSKLLQKGLDPNFQEEESGETPLTLLVVVLSQPRAVILALVEGGAFLDYRNRTGFTAMHCASRNGKKDSIRALLDFGASPNSRDEHGLTPLYHCISSNVELDADCVEMLLRDYAQHGIVDAAGSTELHHACRHGRTKQVEHLLYFRALINSVNKTGNTPLHVCALNNQDSCARLLLFRGADKSIRNYANQDAVQLAQVCGNSVVAELIAQFNVSEAVPHKEKPQYNVMRKSELVSTQESIAKLRPVGKSNLLRLKSFSQSSPDLLDDDSAAPERKKRDKRPQIGSPVAADTSPLHSVGVPTVTADGQVVLKFFKPQRDKYDSDSPCADDNSSTGSFESVCSDSHSAASMPCPDLYANIGLQVPRIAANERASGFYTVSNATSRNRDTLYGKVPSPERDNNVASIRNFHKRLTHRVVSVGMFTAPSTGAESVDIYQNTPPPLNVHTSSPADNNAPRNSMLAPPGDKSETSVTPNSLAFSRNSKIGGSMNSLLDIPSPETATSARGKRQPPPPPNRKTPNLTESPRSRTIDTEASGRSDFTSSDEAISVKAVFKRFGSVDNLFDVGQQRYDATASRPSQQQTHFNTGRNGTINDATSSGMNFDWKQMEASKIAPSPPSAHVNAAVPQTNIAKHPLASQQVNADDDDDDLPPPPLPSQLYFSDSKQSDLIVYSSLPPPPEFNSWTPSLKSRPAADEPSSDYASAANMRVTAQVLLKKLQSGNNGKLPADGRDGSPPPPPPPSFVPPPPSGPALDRQVNVTAAANVRKKAPPAPPKQFGRQQSDENPGVFNLAAIIADKARRRQDN